MTLRCQRDVGGFYKANRRSTLDVVNLHAMCLRRKADTAIVLDQRPHIRSAALDQGLELLASFCLGVLARIVGALDASKLVPPCLIEEPVRTSITAADGS
jgi:hypothetical protein